MANAATTYERLGENSTSGLKMLYERYGRKLYGYAVHRWSLSEDAAWDLVYKTLYRILETHKAYVFESEEKFAAFVFKVFVNYLRNHYRDARRRGEGNEVPFDDAHHDRPQEDETPASPQLSKLQRVLETFEDWERILLLMRGQDMPYSAIARYVGKPEEQLKVYYQRLKKKLLDRMNEPENDSKTGHA